jgi:glycosyltransferase involved in cell wall biosynthesis
MEATMNIGFISTRLAGTDGVTLETEKLAHVLREAGHADFYCAGELEKALRERGLEAPELHFEDPVAVALGQRAFGSGEADAALLADIAARAEELLPPLRSFVRDFDIDFLIIQNAFAIPMQLPLAQALAQLLQETGLPALAHNHDFYWERDRFLTNNVQAFLDTYFPPDLPRLRHATINSLAQRELQRRRGLQSVVIPNVFDFATEPPGIDDYNRDFRRDMLIGEGDWLVLQPTRVVPRKGIELAIELLARLDDDRAKLVITHRAGDEGYDYLEQLQKLASDKGVDLRYVADRVDAQRGTGPDGERIYSLWDAYPHADLVTYPSLVEGFGNALLETVYFRRPALVNRYEVYKADIGPLGFQFAEIDGAVTDEAVAQVRQWLETPALALPVVEHNYKVAARHFSYEALREIFATSFTNFTN